MAKLDGNKRLSRDAMPNSQDWIDPFLINQNQVNDSVVNAIRGNLNHQDNTTSGYFTGNFTHGVERIIRNPLIKSGTNGPSPIGVQSINSQKLYTDSVSAATAVVESVSLRYVNGNDPTAAEQVGVTVRYDLSHTQPCIVATLSADQTINNNSQTKVSYNVIQFSRGSVVTNSSGTFTVSEAGTYSVCAWTRWGVGAFSDVEQYIVVSTGPTAWAAQFDPLAFTVGPYIPISSIVQLLPGNTIEHQVVQVNGAATSRVIQAAAANGNGQRIAINRLYNDTVPTASVTLFFHGG